MKPPQDAAQTSGEALGSSSTHSWDRQGTNLRAETFDEALKEYVAHAQDASMHSIQLVLDYLPAGIVVFDVLTAKILYANRAFAEAYGYSAIETVGKHAKDVIGEDEWAMGQPSMKAVFATLKPVSYVHTRQATDKSRWGEVKFVPQINSAGRVEKIVMLVNEITIYIETQNKLRQSEQRLNTFMDANTEGVVLHSKGKIVDMNPAMCKLVGMSMAQLLGTDILDRVPVSYRALVGAHISSNSSMAYESAVLHADGTEIPVINTGSTTEFHGQRVRMTVVRDARDRIATEQRIHFLAHYDELTGLPNRVHFMTILTEALQEDTDAASAAFSALLFLDLDKFKRINDSLGHAAGDVVLQQAAKRLKQALGADDLLGRFAGDEFVVLLRKRSGYEAVVETAQLLLETLSAPVTYKDHEVPLSASIGIAIYPDHGYTPEELVAHADAAVLSAKRRGRGGYLFYSSAIGDAAYQTFVMEQQMREALRKGEFELYYQPQVSAESGALVGLEALLRWNHPTRGLIYPGDFIPLAEERRLMGLIGDWVMSEAVRTLQSWRLQGFNCVPVSVNLSSQQFEASDFVPKLSLLLQAHEVPSEMIELELTERMLMEDVTLVRQQLRGLRDMGVLVAVDDFGTGFSSLAHLKQYSIDRVKIDQSFVRDLPDATDSAAITRAIVQMSHSLGISVMAEGVETAAQHEFLLKLGCDELQGYMFGRPVPRANIEILLRGNTVCPI
jgi:diguanylate cyclase (GGDEF)-like protein/PAS domain S-box-containing protein